MDQAHRVGQLFMIANPATSIDSRAVAAISDFHVGGIYLAGQSSLSVRQTASITRQLQQHAGGPKLFVCADQEGGQVQRFTGPGFSQIPSGVEQGQLGPAALRIAARQWGGELASAGVNLDLAPVADTVPSAAAAQLNPPIGGFARQYGYDPSTVAAHVTAFAAGMAAAGVAATAKHFPGLGRVSANTDTAAGVTDSQTTPGDPYLGPFSALIRAGVPFVMMSTAVYQQLDPARPAAFSPLIVNQMLRDQLAFRGVVISDDLNAVQVGGIPAARRALDFIAAGGDIVLDVNQDDLVPMMSAVLNRAHRDPAFGARVDAATLRVLSAKQASGLLR
jgi:beta-N-acetylhexosaminidase